MFYPPVISGGKFRIFKLVNGLKLVCISVVNNLGQTLLRIDINIMKLLNANINKTFFENSFQIHKILFKVNMNRTEHKRETAQFMDRIIA